MALDPTIVLEVRLTGSDTNGGGFVPGSSGTDWSQQNAAQYSVTDGVTNGTTTVTSATANFGADVVGNLIFIMGGTGVGASGGWYQVMSRTNNTTIVVDRATALTAGTGTTLTIGGAIATPGLASAILAFAGGGNAFIKYNASPYVITTASVNVQGGCCQPPDTSKIIGYDTIRAIYTPFQNRPTIQLGSGVSSATIFANFNAEYFLQSVILDANNQTSSACYVTSGEAFYVKAMNFTTSGMHDNIGTGVFILCEVTGGGTSAVPTLKCTVAYACVSHDNTVASVNQGAITSSYAIDCISYNNAQDGFGVPAAGGTHINCTAYNNAARGFYLGNTSDDPCIVINCIAEGNGTYGYFTNTGHGQIINCADYNNTSGRKNSATLWNADINPVTGSGSFFVSAAGGDFRLNSTAGAGAAARAAGFPSVFPALASTTNFRDIGAVQHQDAGSSGPVGQLHIFSRGAPY